MSDSSLEDLECKETFIQDGVSLKSATAAYIHYVDTDGTLVIVSYSDNKYAIEWKPLFITIYSEVQDQEWALVNTVEKRTRTLSGNVPPECVSRSKFLRLNFEDFKSFRVSNKSKTLSFYDGKSDLLASFVFSHGNCDNLVQHLKVLLKPAMARRDKHLFVVQDINHLETQQINRSFAELKLDHEPSLWKLMRDFPNNPFEVTMGTFAKFSEYVLRTPDERDFDETTRELLTRSISEFENSSSQTKGDYEVVAKEYELPERKEFSRGKPLNLEQWEGVQDCEGRIQDMECIKLIIFQGGMMPSLREEVWKYLLNYYPWNKTKLERRKILIQKTDEYYSMKQQWKTISRAQEDNFSEYRERKSQIEKDVNRTDRTVDFYAGDNNPNIQMLFDILMTYVMYNFDLGYVQGMSDLLSPILHLLKNEVDAFWCFVGFMNKVESNFDADQSGMKEQLENLHTLLAFVDPPLARYIVQKDSGNMFFCFRWLLVWFKRELSEEDVMAFWEVLWTGFPCAKFHLLVCVAILLEEKQTIMENEYGFTEILKHVNELSGRIDIMRMLDVAHGIFYQIKDAEHLQDNVRAILGLPIPENPSLDSHEASPFECAVIDENTGLPQNSSPNEDSRNSPDEATYDKCLMLNYH